MSTYSMRAAKCPRCDGTVTVVDSPIYVEESSDPVKYAIVKAECEKGCRLAVGDIPERPA